MIQTIRSHFDGVQENFLVGWIHDPKDYPVEVMAMIDGEYAGSCLAQDYRADVEKAGIGNGRFGFRLAIPPRFRAGEKHRIELWIKEGERRLSPFDFQADRRQDSIDAAAGGDLAPASPIAVPARPGDKIPDDLQSAGQVEGTQRLIPWIDAGEALFPMTARSPDEMALFHTVMSELDTFCALYPSTPYYDRLRLAARGTSSLDHFIQLLHSFRQIDRERQGQLPKTGPLVSIIMPVHNRPVLVKDAIRSVLAQSYTQWELIVCDDASTDDTPVVVEQFKDPRIQILRQAKRAGAAAARNKGLERSRGDIIAYLDSDNLWHPRYLEMMVEELARWPGHQAAYAGYFDIEISEKIVRIANSRMTRFHMEDQIAVPFVDMNSFVHRRSLYQVFGGFDEQLNRRQDYDLIARYCWLREPRFLPHVLNLYQRIAHLEQITQVQKHDTQSPRIIADKIAGYYKKGLPAALPSWVKRVTILSWDMSRNHFAKAYCIAEALSKHVEVELIAYRFFEDSIFPPFAGKRPPFECKYLEGGNFPDFFANFAHGVEAITGDVIYAVKPRLTSFGLGLMANHLTGKPLIVECNDLETVVAQAKTTDRHAPRQLEDLRTAGDAAKIPYEHIWSEVLDPLVSEIPTVFTHNVNLNLHYDRRCLIMRNIKDESLYQPDAYDRDAIRAELQFSSDDRVILFGGLVRRHKGIFELAALLNALDDPRYKLLVVGSRETHDLALLARDRTDQVVILPPQPPERMAAINLACDLVILWQDPDVPAGQYQSPYKMSDAFAMGTTVIASPTSDFADFASRGLVLNVAYGDQKRLVSKIKRIFEQPEQTALRRERARKFFEREFSYPAVFPAFALGVAALEQHKVYPVSERFARMFEEFRRRLLEER